MTRIAVIGAGAWGLNHVRVLASDLRCTLVAVADPDPRSVERVRAIQPGVRHSRDADEILADSAIDAVVIATPSPTHARLACAAFAAGKHVLVEKPVALSASDARDVLAACRKSGRVGMVGHLMIYHPAMVRLRQMLHSGQLGRLHYIHSVRVNLGRLRTDENVLWSFGPHDLSMIEVLLEKQPQTVSARGRCVLQPNIEDVVFLTLRYPTGELAHIHLSWLNPRKERRLTLVCSQRMVEFDDVSLEKLRVYDRGYEQPPEFTEFAEYLTIRDGDVHIPQLPMAEPLRLEIGHFLDCIDRGEAPATDLASGVRIGSILEAAQQSIGLDGVPVPLDNLA